MQPPGRMYSPPLLDRVQRNFYPREKCYLGRVPWPHTPQSSQWRFHPQPGIGYSVSQANPEDAPQPQKLVKGVASVARESVTVITLRPRVMQNFSFCT